MWCKFGHVPRRFRVDLGGRDSSSRLDAGVLESLLEHLLGRLLLRQTLAL